MVAPPPNLTTVTGTVLDRRPHDTLPDWDVVTYPARGYMPISFFGPKHAWSVSPNKAKYEAPVEAQIKVTIHAADAKLAPVGAPLKLDYFHVDLGGRLRHRSRDHHSRRHGRPGGGDGGRVA